jgi:hypothetical protein
MEVMTKSNYLILLTAIKRKERIFPLDVFCCFTTSTSHVAVCVDIRLQGLRPCGEEDPDNPSEAIQPKEAADQQ